MASLLSTTTAEELLTELEKEGQEAAVPAGGVIYAVIKRLMDIAVSLSAILLLGPGMLLVAAMIKLTSRGSVIFKQVRAGKNCQPFTMYKFRTMHPDAEEDREFLSHLNSQNGPVFKIPEDPRLIWIGKFLRRSSIDELPQLFNVLMGQMSLVGPRPLWLPEAQQARGVATLRTQVRPGLTCLWQISGRSELTYEQWILLDLYYIRRRNLPLDTLILVQTIPAVLSTHGAY
ncbi:MAG: sugar transferase [Phycisphaerae bacterium]|nr:sugar transferase [Phycisphaerae bacterium]